MLESDIMGDAIFAEFKGHFAQATMKYRKLATAYPSLAGYASARAEECINKLEENIILDCLIEELDTEEITDNDILMEY